MSRETRRVWWKLVSAKPENRSRSIGLPGGRDGHVDAVRVDECQVGSEVRILAEDNYASLLDWMSYAALVCFVFALLIVFGKTMFAGLSASLARIRLPRRKKEQAESKVTADRRTEKPSEDEKEETQGEN